MRSILGISICTLASILAGCASSRSAVVLSDRFTYVQGGIVRGDTSRREFALVFTGDEHGEGAAHILDVLARRGAKASFFVTGNYARNPEFQSHLRRMALQGHYVGPHSDRHLLYAPWEDRDQSLVTRGEFEADVASNIAVLRERGLLAGNGPVYFIPPYEWYNAQHAAWAREMGVVLFNFTPGSGSNRDYMPEADKRFVPSRRILDDILSYERKDPHGLNGYILLLHLGADRRDKMFLLLDELIEALVARGYRFLRVDEMLKPIPEMAAPPGDAHRRTGV